MPKPSIYRQLGATQVKGNHMKVSPRHWNCSLLKYKGRLWCSYRYHLEAKHASRCATAMVALDKATFQPTAPSQHLNLKAVIGDEHFEDARLFMFRGEPHISYTKMTGYQPGHDFNCTVEYARLKLKGNVWFVEDTFHPNYGQNSGFGKEKNWIFFEHDGALHVIYQDDPVRKVLKIDGENVVQEWDSPAAAWQWGTIRGGTPPVPFGDGQMLAIFHSSLQTEDAPHYRRYYGAAYVFDARPPFAVRSISVKPLMSGSEEDRHGHDPRYSAGWKPFIAFPGGLVPDGDGWLVSLGVNDWQCAVGRIRPEHLVMMPPDGSGRPKRYFKTQNGTLQMKMIGADRSTNYVAWVVPATRFNSVMVPEGFYATDDGRLCEIIEETPGVVEITEAEYSAATAPRKRSVLV